MEPTSPISPLAPFPPEPPDEYRSRAPEFYGFVAWTCTTIAFILYLLWALLPDEYIVWLGVEWYPSREWTLLLPAYSIVLVLLTYFVYFSIAIACTPAFSELSTLIGEQVPRIIFVATRLSQHADTKAHLPGLNANPYFKHADPGAIPELYDVPIGFVNQVVYGPHH